MLANRKQGIGFFWLGKLRPIEGKALTQGPDLTADLVRAWNQSLPKPPNISFPCNPLLVSNRQAPKRKVMGQAVKRMGTSQAWCIRRPASDKPSKLSKVEWVLCHYLGQPSILLGRDIDGETEA